MRSLRKGEVEPGVGAPDVEPVGVAEHGWTRRPAWPVSALPSTTTSCGARQDTFHDAFCQDLDDTESLVMATTQRPLARRCLESLSGSLCQEFPGWAMSRAISCGIPWGQAEP